MRRIGAAMAIAMALATATAACGGGSSDGPDPAGAVDQAVERLQANGLTEDEATCVVERLGADAVVETEDINALTDNQDYRDAATECTGG